jgi:two-component system chemotaxis response regulator CheY
MPGRISVLLVDDQPFFRATLSEILRALGVNQIHTAENGATGIEAAQSLDPDMIFADWTMPEMDGIEMTRAIRMGALRRRDIPIVLITGRNRQSDILEARNAGVDEILIKPINVRGVQERLTLAIENPRPFIESLTYVGPCRRRRPNPNYMGPRRRMTDPLEVFTETDDIRKLRALMAASVRRIAELSRTLSTGTAVALRPIYMAAIETEAVAMQIKDDWLARASKSLLRYLDAVGRSERFEIEVLETHLAALQTLLEVQASDVATRSQVTLGLEAVVRKKLAV